MPGFTRKIIFLFVLFNSTLLLAQQVDILSTQTSKYVESDPTSSLRSLDFVEMKKRVLLPDDQPAFAHYMTDTRAVLRTDQVSHLEDYALVQFIRGCEFESSFDGQTVKKMMSIAREHFGKTVPFQHKQWTIDTDNTDPVYTSEPGQSRFVLYRWNTDPTSLDADQAKWYGDGMPTAPVVFATDLPGSGFLQQQGPVSQATNTSLEFRTCLYHTADLPLTTDPAGSGMPIGKEIKCFSWSHKFIYNYGTQKFDEGGALDPFCLQ